MVKTKVWVIVVAALAAVSVALALLFAFLPRGGTVAKVYVDGECVYTVDLATVEEAYRHVVHTPYGDNTLLVEHGRICVEEADCKGADCVHRGWISAAGNPIVCVPHHLVVRVEGTQGNEVVL